MEEVNLNEKYALFIATLNECGKNLLKATKEDIEYHLFEEFDGDSISFLHKDLLLQLLEFGFIDEEIFNMSFMLAQKYRNLEGTDLWTVEAVKTTTEWREILTLSDYIKDLIKKRR